MKQNLFHGILVNMAFTNIEYPENYIIFSKKEVGEWIIYGIEISKNNIDKTIVDIQNNMRSDQIFYNHIYDDELLIVIFKDKVFHISSHSSSWDEIIKFGNNHGIPKEQLDFWPNRFQDEHHYFSD